MYDNDNENNLENMPENTSGNIQEDTSENISESISGDAAEDKAESISGSTPAAEEQKNYGYYSYNNQNVNTTQSTIPPAPAKKVEKKPRSRFKKAVFAVIVAVIVGAAAGGTFYGVNYLGNRFVYDLTDSGDDDADDETITDTIERTGASSGSSTDSSSSSSDDDGMTVREVTEECLPSVVTIATVSKQELSNFFGGTQEYETEAAGTGVIIGTNDEELLIATNYHVVYDATSLSVGFIDESTVDASIKGLDKENDLAVISVKLSDISDDTMSGIKIAEINTADEPQLGDQVVAIGNALGYGQSVTSGYISAKGRSLTLSDGVNTYEATDLIQTDAAINAGNSGGALFNMNGELIGINEAKVSSSSGSTSVEGMGYAIPISKAQPILEKLMTMETKEKVSDDEKGYLGVTLANVTDDVSKMYNMPVGVCVTEVIEGSPAEDAGILAGDVITAVDDTTVETYDDITGQLDYYASGEKVTLTVMRADNGSYEEQKIDVTLGDSNVIEGYQSSRD